VVRSWYPVLYTSRFMSSLALTPKPPSDRRSDVLNTTSPACTGGECAFWDEGEGGWSKRGCRTVATLPASGLHSNGTAVTICETLHLTHFSGKPTLSLFTTCVFIGQQSDLLRHRAALVSIEVDWSLFDTKALTPRGATVLAPIETVITAGETTFKEVVSPNPEPKSLAVVILFLLVNLLFAGTLYAWHFAPHRDHPATVKQIKQSRYGCDRRALTRLHSER
jgi:hypothetical protein